MKIFAKIIEVGAAVQGQGLNGNVWTKWPVVAECQDGDSKLALDVFRDQLPEGIVPGAEGWLRFTVRVVNSRNGGKFNAFRFGSFTPVVAAKGANLQPAGISGDGGAVAAPRGEKAAQIENFKENEGQGTSEEEKKGDGLPF